VNLMLIRILRWLCIATILTLPLASSVYGQASQPAQEVERTPAREVLLNVSGEVERPLKLTTADLAKLPRQTVHTKDHLGKEVTFEGVQLGEVLKLAGVKFGEQLRGKDLALFLVIDAADNYRAVFALPELDHAFTDRVILLADKRDSTPLAPSEGPLRIVAPGEKRQARWVRQVSSLTIRRAQ
jgi:DMSO/TMAO reductase YedYZ molybdopterin-dependent catalytic subunit